MKLLEQAADREQPVHRKSLKISPYRPTLYRNKKNKFRKRLKYILGQHKSSHIYSYQESPYIIAVYYSKYFPNQQKDYCQFLQGISIINYFVLSLTEIQCHLIACSVFQLIFKYTTCYSMLKSLTKVCSFTKSQLGKGQAVIFEFVEHIPNAGETNLKRIMNKIVRYQQRFCYHYHQYNSKRQ